MSYQEIVKSLEIMPISVSDDKEEDYRFRADVLKDIGRTDEYKLIVWRKDRFRLNPSHQNRSDLQNCIIEVEDVSVDWMQIQSQSTDDALLSFFEELISLFPDLGGEMANVRYMEIVKVVDLEPIDIEDRGESYVFRIEILSDPSLSPQYRAKVYKKDRFELQPSFSKNGVPVYQVASPVVLVEDEEGLLGNIEGHTPEEVIAEAISARNKLEERIRGS